MYILITVRESIQYWLYYNYIYNIAQVSGYIPGQADLADDDKKKFIVSRHSSLAPEATESSKQSSSPQQHSNVSLQHFDFNKVFSNNNLPRKSDNTITKAFRLRVRDRQTDRQTYNEYLLYIHCTHRINHPVCSAKKLILQSRNML